MGSFAGPDLGRERITAMARATATLVWVAIRVRVGFVVAS
jgi:hypothetical protein